MAKRTSKTVHMGISREEAEKAMSEYAQAEARLQSINAKMEAEMNKIRAKYAEDVAALEHVKDEHFRVVEQYAVEHRTELFQGKKKVELVHGAFGFRAGSPKLALRSGFLWPDVVRRCREFLPDYVKTTYDVAKSKLLADRNIDSVRDNFEKIGVEVVAEEKFFIETKK